MVNLAEISLAPDVVWVGVLPGQLCRSADQVNARLEQVQHSGRSYSPEVLAERDGVVLFDPHVEPPAEIPELHQIAIVHDNQVQEIRDYPTRVVAEAAFEAMQ
ncbi:MAG TPA: hypothetical protein VGP54_09410 [Gaiellaceae bacterium]|jgi:hypothetical protein|nr:hypothetical protein [Gaiellaceae bacterium]